MTPIKKTPTRVPQITEVAHTTPNRANCRRSAIWTDINEHLWRCPLSAPTGRGDANMMLVEQRRPDTLLRVSEKQRYEIDLSNPVPTSSSDVGLQIRTIAPADLAGLASLMLDAYIGTIDYEGEDLDDAMEEVRSFLDDPDSLLDRSYVVEDEGQIVSAVLVSMSQGRPFIGYVMTIPSHKKQGLARLVITHALRRLADDGHERVVLHITDGNTPSENLFRSVGAVHLGS